MKHLSILIYYIFLISPAWSDMAPPTTVKAAVQHALERNPDLLRAREAVHQADSDYSTARTKVFPTIEAQTQGSYLKDSSNLNFPNFGGTEYNQYQVFFTLSQPVSE